MPRNKIIKPNYVNNANNHLIQNAKNKIIKPASSANHSIKLFCHFRNSYIQA